ncbi:hypothetical protein GF342_00345 [Candidatus Woesearchaeota archaeon]|nr:hypothetical protein [Candidatus Woesearchaeota archaeon]
MGHTVWSQRMNAERIITELLRYKKALRSEQQALFDELLKRSMNHLGTISYANSMHTWALLLLSILLEQEQRIKKLEHVVNRYLSKKEQDRRVAENENDEYASNL